MVYEGSHKLGDLFSNRREKGRPDLPTISVTLTNGLVDRDSLDRKTDTNLSESEHLLVKRGDIAYNMMRMWQGASGLAEHDGIVSPAYVVLAPKRSIDSRYAAYLFKSQRLIYLFWAYSHGLTSDRLRLYFDDFARIPVSIPDLSEQTNIEEILTTWDKATETIQRLIATSRIQKQALSRQLLTGTRRILGFGGEWRTVRLDELCDVRRGASPRPIDDERWFSEHGRAWIRIADVTASKTPYLRETTQYLSEDGAQRSVAVDPGDLIMSICATIGLPKFVDVPACIHDGFVVFRNVQDRLSKHFLYHYLSFNSEILSAGGQPGTQKNINTSIVGKIRVPTISLDEQDRISSLLFAAQAEIVSFENELACLRRERAALMQQLLTGKRRVKLDATA